MAHHIVNHVVHFVVLQLTNIILCEFLFGREHLFLLSLHLLIGFFFFLEDIFIWQSVRDYQLQAIFKMYVRSLIIHFLPKCIKSLMSSSESFDLRRTIHTSHLLRVEMDWFFWEYVLSHSSPVVCSTSLVILPVVGLSSNVHSLYQLIDLLLLSIRLWPLNKTFVALATFALLCEHFIIIVGKLFTQY